MNLKTSEEKQKIADSILDSVYQKLLEANATKENILQAMLDAGLSGERWGGIEYLVGKLLMKAIDDFIDEKYDTQIFFNICTIAMNLTTETEATYLDFNGWWPLTTNAPLYLIKDYVVNIIMHKTMREKPKFRELFAFLNGDSLKYVSDELKTEEMCMAVVKKDWRNFRYVPDNLKTEEMCRVAVQVSSYNLKYIPNSLKTPELCMMAVKEDGHLIFVPDSLITKEICTVAVQVRPCVLEHIPDDLKTPELCMMAVKVDGYAIQFVPDELKTEKMCLIAIKNRQNMRLKARFGGDLSEDWKKVEDVFKHIPEHLKTAEICLIALQNSEIFGFMPENIRECIDLKILYYPHANFPQMDKIVKGK